MLASWQRHRIRDAPPSQWARLRMSSRILVQCLRPNQRAQGFELCLSRDDDRTADRRLLIPLRDVAQSTTQYTGIGWLLPLSSIGGQAVSLGGDVSACFVSSVRRICPASAAEQSR